MRKAGEYRNSRVFKPQPNFSNLILFNFQANSKKPIEITKEIYEKYH